MRLFIGEGHPDAPTDQPWAVCSDDGPVSFHATRDLAFEALVAAMGDGMEPAGEAAIPFEAVLMFQDVQTSDHRIFHDVRNRELPLTLMYQFTTSWGHDGAQVAGRIDEIDPADAQGRIMGRGFFDGGEVGEECARVVANQTVRGISVDMASCESMEVEIMEFDDDGWPVEWLEHYTGASIMGATVLPFPAFEGAEIWIPEGAAAAAAAQADSDTGEAASRTTVRARLASAAPPAGDFRPPAAWFERPVLGDREPLHVEEDGRVWGHIYGWGECHIGESRYCLTASPSPSGYAYFNTGAVLSAEGIEIAAGCITIETDHATTERNISWAQAQDHYAHTGLAVADVVAGDDEFGIWIAGAVRPGTAPEKVHALRASKPSGDWREIGGRLDLVGVLGVNTPGYPMPRARVASGKVVALVAAVGSIPASEDDCGCGGAGAAKRVSMAEFSQLAATVDRIDRATRAQQAAALMERIRS